MVYHIGTVHEIYHRPLDHIWTDDFDKKNFVGSLLEFFCQYFIKTLNSFV
jgi:hypothetical protein